MFFILLKYNEDNDEKNNICNSNNFFNLFKL